MTLRLALVIDGDPAGARKALEETGRGVEDLGAKAEAAGRRASNAGKGFEWLSQEEERARLGLRETEAAAGGAAGELRSVDEAGRNAARGVQQAGEAAASASGRFSGIQTALIGAAGGLAASIGAAAIGELFKGAVAGAQALAREILTSAPQIERALAGHEKLIGGIKDLYSEAAGAASSYGLNSSSVLRFEAQQNVSRLTGAAGAAQRDLLTDGAVAEVTQRSISSADRAAADLGPLRETVAAIRRDLREGEADVIAFRREVAEIAEALPEDSPFRGMAEKILADTRATADLQAELQRSRDLLKGLQGDADAAATALGGSADKYRQVGAEAAGAAGSIGQTTQQITASGSAAAAATERLEAYRRALASAGGGAVPSTQPSGPARPFAAGGYTGDDDVAAPAGIVHGQEFVVNARATRRHRPLLEAINSGLRGYAAGGYVGAGDFPAAPTIGGYHGAASGSAGSIFADGAKTMLSELLYAIGKADFEGFWERMLDVGMGIADRLLGSWIDTIVKGFEDAFKNAASGAGGSGIGGFLKGFVGGFQPGYSPAASALIAAGGGGLYDKGGPTGGSDPARIAGFVHEQEFVFDAPATRRIGVPVLEALRRGAMPGYRDGGHVGGHGGGGGSIGGGWGGGPGQIIFQNLGTPQREVSRREEDDGRGGRRTIVQVDDQVAGLLARPSSRTSRQLSSMGAEPRRPIR